MGIQQAINHIAGNQERKGVPTQAVADFLIKDSEGVASRGLSKSKRTLNDALDDFEAAKKTVLRASDELQIQMESHSRQAKDSVSRAKDAAAQMADAMNKITKVLGPDFEKRLEQLDHLTGCMERLSKLNESGKLTGVLAALR